jgi:hypothetical protein
VAPRLNLEKSLAGAKTRCYKAGGGVSRDGNLRSPGASFSPSAVQVELRTRFSIAVEGEMR